MKKNIIILTILILIGNSVLGQGRNKSFFTDEFNYVSIKVGLTHSFLDKQPSEFNYKFIHSPRGEMKIYPVEKYTAYTSGYLAGLTFTHDLKQIKTGFIVGVIYENYGISSKYRIDPKYGDYSVIERNSVNAVSLPLYLKFGYRYFKKNFDTNMQYMYIGLNYNMNQGITRVEKLSWNETDVFKSQLEKAHIKYNVVPVFGYNRGFGNIEIKFVPKGFFGRNNDVSLYNGTKDVKPYSVEPKGVLYITTSFTIPVNDWTKRKSFKIAQFIQKRIGGN